MRTCGPAVSLFACVALLAGASQARAQEAPSAVTNGVDTLASPSPATGDVAGHMPGLEKLFSSLATDFRQLASRQNLMLAGVGLATSTSVHAFDGNVARSRWGGRSAAPVFDPGRTVGSFATQLGGAFGTYLVGRATNTPEVATLGAELFRAQVVAQATTQALKIGTRRTRPDGTTLSFPSGHTAAGFATASVLHSKYGWKAAIPAYSVASWIAASRMQSKRHYLSDVIAGATIGIMAGRSVTIGAGSKKFSVAPMAVPGGIGVSLARVDID